MISPIGCTYNLPKPLKQRGKKNSSPITFSTFIILYVHPKQMLPNRGKKILWIKLLMLTSISIKRYPTSHNHEKINKFEGRVSVLV